LNNLAILYNQKYEFGVVSTIFPVGFRTLSNSFILSFGFSKCSINSEDQIKSNELFSKGRHADIFVNEKKVGEIGEIDSNILENFRIRTSVVGFEIKLSGLIFD